VPGGGRCVRGLLRGGGGRKQWVAEMAASSWKRPGSSACKARSSSARPCAMGRSDALDLHVGDPPGDVALLGLLRHDGREGRATQARHHHSRWAFGRLPAEQFLIEGHGIRRLIAAVVKPDERVGHVTSPLAGGGLPVGSRRQDARRPRDATGFIDRDEGERLRERPGVRSPARRPLRHIHPVARSAASSDETFPRRSRSPGSYRGRHPELAGWRRFANGSTLGPRPVATVLPCLFQRTCPHGLRQCPPAHAAPEESYPGKFFM